MTDLNANKSRRQFIKKLGGTAAAVIGTPVAMASSTGPQILKRRSAVPANDRINVACIGMGLMGFGDVNTALTQDGVEFIAAADCYQGHLTKIKEVYGEQVKTTMNFHEILDNPEVDAVIIATPDHWHDRMSIEAMKKGKAVYCEKPMVQEINEGHEVIKVHQQTKVPFQVGSQWASSIAMQKAKELYEAGEIGELNFVEVYTDRFDARGAWQYSIPPDASKQTCDWEMFQGDATDLPFDPVRFFRWRNYQDYGTGMAGDLFVHLFTRLHTITGSHGPDRIYATGGLRYWEDGRDVADVMLGLLDYPETDKHPAFNMSLRVNFVDGSGGGDRTRLVGNEGEMVLGGNSVTIRKKKLPKAPGFGGWDTYETFPEATQEAFKEKYYQQYGDQKVEMIPPGEMTYSAPDGYDMRQDHFADWFNAIRNGGQPIEDPVFGLRAAGPALACNMSLYQNKLINWDPEKMQVVSA
ncbi:Gfo/Idh/MocA family protein [Catalinimonas niigatensis]|uniref:Gfo/Idh/MocA family protein n=1 Tax=Catalinimonas niigatensis TaxID=1397264 RepID=UPI00266671F6|nr:Gfo/Idh/MocA family oxidoreductase [Catalinimonas niigatensis]WPP50642.1 Gfo/Idh/MocA family oxidoreductase [Catalinimonas niigatensis]